MWKQFGAAAIVMAFLAGAAPVAYAQSTLDPRGATTGSSTTNRLGPSTRAAVTGGNGTLGAGDLPGGNWSGTAGSTGSNAAGDKHSNTRTGRSYGASTRGAKRMGNNNGALPDSGTGATGGGR
jgi:hypothetical protein